MGFFATHQTCKDNQHYCLLLSQTTALFCKIFCQQLNEILLSSFIFCNQFQQLSNNELIQLLRNINEIMKSPKLKQNLILNCNQISKAIENQQCVSQSLQLKSWNEQRPQKISSSLHNSKLRNIFSLNNKSTSANFKNKYINTFHHSPRQKPKTATQSHIQRKTRYSTGHSYQNKNFLSQELAKLGAVSTSQVLDENFQQNLQSINFYPQFRASMQQRRNLLYLKPYIKTNYDHKKQSNQKSLDKIEKLKSQLYHGIFEAEQLFTLPEDSKNGLQNMNQNQPYHSLHSNRTVIEYMTEYQGDKGFGNTKTAGHKKRQNSWVGKTKNSSITILREKLKNRYKQSNYAQKMVRIKKGQGIPITILQ